MKELGIPGITFNDIWFKSWDQAYLDKLKAAAKENGIQITGVIAEGNVVSDDESKRAAQMAEDAMKMRAAAYLGAPIIRINLGSTGRPEDDGTVGVERAIDAFNQLLPLAKELNLKLTIENHGGVSKTADWIIAVIKGTDPEWVGSCLDFGNWPDDIRNLESAKLAPYAHYVHAKTHNFRPDGEDENKDYKTLLSYLKDAGYKGDVSIEFEGPGDQVEGVRKTRDLILKHWPEQAG